MKASTIGWICILCALLAWSAQPLSAQESEVEGAEGAEEWMEEGRHEIGLFLGATVIEGDAGPSAGLDYEYRLSRPIGIGAVLEWTGADFREGLAGVTFNWHAWRELKVVAAPAVEIEPAEREGNFAVRLGAEYGFAIGSGYELAPALFFDITSEDVAYVIGASVARSF